MSQLPIKDDPEFEKAFKNLMKDLVTPKDRSSALHNIENLVFQGGGVKGVAYVGVLEELETQNPDFLPKIKKIAGTSAGSMLALYLGLNMEVSEIKKLICDEDFFNFLDDDVKLSVCLNPDCVGKLYEYEDYSVKNIIFGAFEELKTILKNSKSPNKETSDKAEEELTALLNDVIRYYAQYAGLFYQAIISLLGNFLGRKLVKWLVGFLDPTVYQEETAPSPTEPITQPATIGRSQVTSPQINISSPKAAFIQLIPPKPAEISEQRDMVTGQLYLRPSDASRALIPLDSPANSPGIQDSRKIGLSPNYKGMSLKNSQFAGQLSKSGKQLLSPISNQQKYESNMAEIIKIYASSPTSQKNKKPNAGIKLNPINGHQLDTHDQTAEPPASRNRSKAPTKPITVVTNLQLAKERNLNQPGQQGSPLSNVMFSVQNEEIPLNNNDEEGSKDMFSSTIKKVLANQAWMKDEAGNNCTSVTFEPLKVIYKAINSALIKKPEKNTFLHYAIAELICDIFFREDSKVYGKDKQMGLFTGSEVKKRLIQKPIHDRVTYYGNKIADDYNPTFKDLAGYKNMRTGKPCFRNFYVTAFNTRTLRTEVFSVDHTPDAVVADVIRASMSIPIFFKAANIKEGHSFKRIFYDNGKPSQPISYMDGGIFDNFPIWIFDDMKYCFPEELGIKFDQRINITNPKTLGFKLMEKKRKEVYTEPYKDDQLTKLRSLVEDPYTGKIFNILGLLLRAETGEHEESKYINQGNWTRTVYVEDCGVSTFAFKMEQGDKKNLMTAGKNGVKEYLDRAGKKFAKEGAKGAKLFSHRLSLDSGARIPNL